MIHYMSLEKNDFWHETLFGMILRVYGMKTFGF